MSNFIKKEISTHDYNLSHNFVNVQGREFAVFMKRANKNEILVERIDGKLIKASKEYKVLGAIDKNGILSFVDTDDKGGAMDVTGRHITNCDVNVKHANCDARPNLYLLTKWDDEGNDYSYYAEYDGDGFINSSKFYKEAHTFNKFGVAIAGTYDELGKFSQYILNSELKAVTKGYDVIFPVNQNGVAAARRHDNKYVFLNAGNSYVEYPGSYKLINSTTLDSATPVTFNDGSVGLVDTLHGMPKIVSNKLQGKRIHKPKNGFVGVVNFTADNKTRVVYHAYDLKDNFYDISEKKVVYNVEKYLAFKELFEKSHGKAIKKLARGYFIEPDMFNDLRIAYLEYIKTAKLETLQKHLRGRGPSDLSSREIDRLNVVLDNQQIELLNTFGDVLYAKIKGTNQDANNNLELYDINESAGQK